MAEQTIPLGPLPGMPTSDGSVLTLPDIPIPDDFAKAGAQYADTAANDKRYLQAQDAIQKVSQNSGTGTMAHIISVLAALSGNFGPAMAINEQKRKTAIGQETMPALQAIQSLTNHGQYQEAVDIANKASVAVGDRAPEIVKILQGISATALEKQRQWKQSDDVQKMFADAIKDSPDHPSRPLLNAWGKMNKSGSPIALEVMKDLMGKMGLHVQDIGGRMTKTNTVTGVTTSTPMPTTFSEKDISGTIGKTLSGQTGLLPNEIVNMMNGLPVIRNGENLTADPVIVGNVLNSISTLQGREATMDIASKIPREPTIAAALEELGIDRQRQAKGDYTHEDVTKAINLVSTRKNQDAVAVANAQQDIPAGSMSVPMFIYDRNSFERDPYISMNEAKKQQDKFVPLTQEENKKFMPMANLYNRLQLFESIVPTLSTLKDPIGRVNDYVAKQFNRFFGVDPDTISTRTVQTLLKDSIEQYANASGISADRYRELTAPFTGLEATKEGAVAALSKIRESLKIDMNQLMKQGDHGISDTSSLTGQAGAGWDRRNTPGVGAIRQATNQLAEGIAKDYGVPPKLVLAILASESDSGAFTIHREGDGYGPMQITHNKKDGSQSTAERMADIIKVPVDKVLNDPATNIRAGTALLRELLKQHNGDEWLAARDYNGSGPAAEAYASRVTGVTGPGKASERNREAAAVLAPKIQGGRPVGEISYKGRKLVAQ